MLLRSVELLGSQHSSVGRWGSWIPFDKVFSGRGQLCGGLGREEILDLLTYLFSCTDQLTRCHAAEATSQSMFEADVAAGGEVPGSESTWLVRGNGEPDGGRSTDQRAMTGPEKEMCWEDGSMPCGGEGQFSINPRGKRVCGDEEEECRIA